MAKPHARERKPSIVCICNQISRETIVAAIKRGCRTTSMVGNATTAGAGQCGGTCRPEIEKLIAEETKNKG